MTFTAEQVEQELVECRSGYAEDATGCDGAGDYVEWAKEQGYPHLEPLDQTSSAGDWCFIVSRGGEIWYPMSQTNNYPGPGFTREVDEASVFYGDRWEASQEAWEVLMGM